MPTGLCSTEYEEDAYGPPGGRRPASGSVSAGALRLPVTASREEGSADAGPPFGAVEGELQIPAEVLARRSACALSWAEIEAAPARSFEADRSAARSRSRARSLSASARCSRSSRTARTAEALSPAE